MEKAVEKNKSKLEDKIQSVLRDIDNAINQDDTRELTNEESTPINTEEINRKVEQINQRLSKLTKQQNEVKKLNEEHQPWLKKIRSSIGDSW